MDATRFYPTYTGPALFELLLDSSKRLPGCFREVYGYEGADHHGFPFQKMACSIGKYGGKAPETNQILRKPSSILAAGFQ
jgi:hypothetical protein